MADVLLQLLLLLSPFWGPFVLLWTVQATTRMHAHYRLFAIVVPVFLVLDQVTKYWARDAMKLRERIEVIPGFFNLTHQENPGAAWGILATNEHRLVFFAVITVVAFVVILAYYRNLKDDERVLAWGLALIFSGAAGNFIDRMSPKHSVTDFLDFYASGAAGPIVRKVLGSAHWPAFNVADSCISIGVTLFVIHILFLEKRTRPDETEASLPAKNQPASAVAGGSDDAERPAGEASTEHAGSETD